MMGVPIVTLGLPNRHVSNVTKSLSLNMEHAELAIPQLKNVAIITKSVKQTSQIDHYSKLREEF